MSVSLLRLHELYESLTPSERRIADYFETNLDKLVDTSILEVAEACQTSKSAVVRLCKKSGYRGYKDFLNAVSADLAVRSSRTDEPTDILPGSSIAEICHIVTANSIRSLENTLSVLDMDAMSRAVDAISHANRRRSHGCAHKSVLHRLPPLRLLSRLLYGSRGGAVNAFIARSRRSFSARARKDRPHRSRAIRGWASRSPPPWPPGRDSIFQTVRDRAGSPS